MISAVDTSVVLDVLTASPEYCESSIQALTQASSHGALIVCPVVVAELRLAFPSDDALLRTLHEMGLMRVALDTAEAVIAGRMHQLYYQRGGKRQRVVADFLIGAHAQVHAQQLIARDRGFFRDYFTELEVWYPT